MNLFELFALLKLDKSDYEKGLSGAETKANSFGSKLSSVFSAATKAITAGVVAGTTAVTALVTAGVDAYSSYEQLVGGVDTLFKDASARVQEYAANAYNTAGMSANDYMETVTSFSASLLQSLDGDTTAAADKANEAITDMSDNANKMGTSMESIQNAYQGFAKQNYTMLDNLKLGYGGTKEEMERLLEDAGKISGITYDISSYADVVDAIHVMQESMGIAGTTAKEASTTIEGSFNSMKSAWENLVAGLGNKDADLSALIGNLVDSAQTYAGNLIPVVEQAITGVGTLVENLVPQIVGEIPVLINNVAPQLLASGKNMISSIIKGITTNAKEIANGAIRLVEMFASSILELLPQVIEMGGTLIASIIEGIITALPVIADTMALMLEDMADDIENNLPTIIEEAIALIQNFADALFENLPIVIDAGIDLIEALAEGIAENLPMIIEEALTLLLQFSQTLLDNMPQIIDTGLDLILGLVQGIVDALPIMIEMLPQIIDNFANVINENMPRILECGIQIIIMLVKGLIDSIPVIIANLPMIIKAIWDTFTAFQWLDLGKNIMNLFKNGIVAMKGAIGDAGKNIFDAIEGVLKKLPETLKSLGSKGIKGMIEGIKGMISSLLTNAGYLLLELLSKFESFSLKDVGVNMIKGLIEGIVSMGSKLFSSVTNLLTTAISTAKDALGIHSPSKVFAGIGDYMVQGLMQGWDNNIDDVKDTIADDLTFGTNDVAMSASYDLNANTSRYLQTAMAQMGALPDDIADAISGMNIKLNSREVGRMVREYA